MSVTILPCPFCGWDDVVIDEIAPGIAAICCDECQTIGPHCDGVQSVEDAIARWNVPAAKMQQLARHDAVMTDQVLRLEGRIALDNDRTVGPGAASSRTVPHQ